MGWGDDMSPTIVDGFAEHLEQIGQRAGQGRRNVILAHSPTLPRTGLTVRAGFCEQGANGCEVRIEHRTRR